MTGNRCIVPLSVSVWSVCLRICLSACLDFKLSTKFNIFWSHNRKLRSSLILMEFSVALLDILISDIRYCVSAAINDIYFRWLYWSVMQDWWVSQQLSDFSDFSLNLSFRSCVSGTSFHSFKWACLYQVVICEGACYRAMWDATVVIILIKACVIWKLAWRNDNNAAYKSSCSSTLPQKHNQILDMKSITCPGKNGERSKNAWCNIPDGILPSLCQ